MYVRKEQSDPLDRGDPIDAVNLLRFETEAQAGQPIDDIERCRTTSTP